MAYLPSDIIIKTETRPVTVFKEAEHNDVEFEGLFHKFGVDFYETNEGVANYSVALIELKNGTVVMRPVCCIRFNDIKKDD